jgi:branched-chain amino acid aminotransferase
MMQQNRSFKFGDGLFETMRWHSGKIFNLEAHFSRLTNGLNILGIEIPNHFSADALQTLVTKAIHQQNQNANSSDWRVRISCFRGGAGLYSPVSNHMEYDIEVSPLSTPDFRLNVEGLRLGRYSEVQITTDILSNLKTTSALPYVMAARFRQNNPLIDDCILLNHHRRIAETIAANLFYRIGDDLYTPSLSEGGVAGTMRQLILSFAGKLGLKAHQQAITLEDISQAEEIFLTNAIQGLRWVSTLDFSPSNKLNNTYSQKIVKQLNLLLSEL